MYQTIKELAETAAASVQGTTVGTKYGLQPILYLKDIVDAAQNQLFFANFCTVIKAQEGVHDVVYLREQHIKEDLGYLLIPQKEQLRI